MPPIRTKDTVAVTGTHQEEKKGTHLEEIESAKKVEQPPKGMQKVNKENIYTMRLPNDKSSKKPRLIIEPVRGTVNLLNGHSYFENRLGVGIYGLSQEKKKSVRMEIAKDTVEYANKNGDLGKPWCEKRFKKVMKEEKAGKYDKLDQNTRAIKIFTDVLFGIDIDQYGNDLAEEVDWAKAVKNFLATSNTARIAVSKAQQERRELLGDLALAGMEGVTAKLGLKPSQWVSRALLLSMVSHAWNQQYLTRPEWSDVESESTNEPEIADDAILVSQDHLNDVGRALEALNELEDAAKIESRTRALINTIHEITGNGELYSESEAADFKARRDAGESTHVSWDSLAGHYESLGVFFHSLDDDGDEIDEEDEDWDGSDMYNPDTRVDAIHQITWIQRWNEELDESEQECRVLSIKRKVLSGILGKVGSEGRSE